MKLKPLTTPGKKPRKFSTPAAAENIQLKNLLVTMDFSDAARARYAVTLAKQFGSTVSLIHVIEPPLRMARMEAVILARADVEVDGSVRVQLERLAERERDGDVHMTGCVRIGKPYQEITEVAPERTTDLIVLTTHGYTGLKNVWLGSNAKRVVRHASCTVLTVRGIEAKVNL